MVIIECKYFIFFILFLPFKKHNWPSSHHEFANEQENQN
jgi:hypothetical protein